MLRFSKQARNVSISHAVVGHATRIAVFRLCSRWDVDVSVRRLCAICTSTQRSDRSRLFSSSSSDSSNNSTDSYYKHDPLTSSKKWVDTIVIREQLCPFVDPLKVSNKLRFVASKSSDAREAVEDFATEAKLLLPEYRVTKDKENAIEGLFLGQPDEDSPVIRSHGATVMAFHGPFVKKFEDFDLLCEEIYAKVLIDMKFFPLLAVKYFHPNYVNYYEERPEDVNDCFYYAMRSPYPTMVLIPEEDYTSALESDLIPEELSLMNKIKFVEQEIEVCQARLQACYVHDFGKSKSNSA
jgi:hypothetical protein